MLKHNLYFLPPLPQGSADSRSKTKDVVLNASLLSAKHVLIVLAYSRLKALSKYYMDFIWYKPTSA